MSAIADLSDIVNRGTGGNNGTPDNIFCFKDARVAGAAATAPIAGRMASLWQYDGQPSHGAVPTTVAIPTNATDGGLKQTDPGGGRQKWYMGAVFSGLVAGTVYLYDRLLHIGSLDGTLNTAQAVGGTITRYTGGAGNQILLEIYTIIGVTGTTVTAAYINQDGAAKTTQATGVGATGFREVSRMIQLPLATGDTGVRSITSVTLAATTGTAGNFGITLAHGISWIPIGVAGAGAQRDHIAGLPPPIEIMTDACLAMGFHCNTTTAPQLYGSVHMIEA